VHFVDEMSRKFYHIIEAIHSRPVTLQQILAGLTKMK